MTFPDPPDLAEAMTEAVTAALRFRAVAQEEVLGLAWWATAPDERHRLVIVEDRKPALDAPELDPFSENPYTVRIPPLDGVACRVDDLVLGGG